jgi:hypothetical protein
VPRRPQIAALTAATAALAVAAVLAATAARAAAPAGSAAAPKPCKPPHGGYRACLELRYRHAADGSAAQIHVRAVLLRRADRCPGRAGQRRLTLTHDGNQRLAAAQASGRCRHGIVQWIAELSPADTAGWHLAPGDAVRASWTGTSTTTSVEIAGTSPP